MNDNLRVMLFIIGVLVLSYAKDAGAWASVWMA